MIFRTQIYMCRLSRVISHKLVEVYSPSPRRFFRPLIRFFRVLLDGQDVHSLTGGGGYAKYGVDVHAGAIAVIRPDGYVGTIVPLERVDLLDAYFARFMLQPL